MANGELAGRGFVHELAEDLASAEQRIQAARKAGGHAPVQGGRVLREYRCGNRGATRHGAQAGMFQKGTTLHMGWLLGGNSVWDIAGDTPQILHAVKNWLYAGFPRIRDAEISRPAQGAAP